MNLIIDNSYSQIANCPSQHFAKLRELLSYVPDEQAAFFSGYRGQQRRYLLDRKGFFPTGLLGEVAQYLSENKIVAEVLDSRIIPDKTPKMFLLKSKIKPYELQLQAIDVASTYPRAGFQMPTGSGKSFTMALLINRLQVKTLVIVPNLELKKQLATSFQEWFGKNPNLVVENIDSPKLKTLTKFDCLILDECHHAASKTYITLNKTAWKNIYHRYFFSGTFFRNNPSESLPFTGVCGDLAFQLTYKQAVEAKMIVPVEAYYIACPKVEIEGSTWSQVYSKAVVSNDKRNKLIANLLLDLQAVDKSTLCLVKEIKHGQILSEMTGIPFANGQDEDSRQYIRQLSEGAIKSLIATTGVAGEGSDTRNCEFVVIAGLGKAKSAFIQQVGRALRRAEGKESGKVIIFKDRSHKYSIRHFNEQVKILKEEYDVEPMKLEG